MFNRKEAPVVKGCYEFIQFNSKYETLQEKCEHTFERVADKNLSVIETFEYDDPKYPEKRIKLIVPTNSDDST